MREFDKMIMGEMYSPFDEELQNLRNYSVKMTREFNQQSDTGERNKILQKLLGKCGKNCYITPNFFCDYGCNIELEDNVYFNANCVVLDCAKVKIGENTLIGPNVQLYTPIHPLDIKSRNSGFESAKPITIGKNCWLGGSVVVLPGVNIADGCVIGAGAVVTKDIPPNSLAVGNPARVIRTIEQD